MEGSVDLGYRAMHRPGVELAMSQSQVRRPNHYTSEPPNSMDKSVDEAKQLTSGAVAASSSGDGGCGAVEYMY